MFACSKQQYLTMWDVITWAPCDMGIDAGHAQGLWRPGW